MFHAEHSTPSQFSKVDTYSHLDKRSMVSQEYIQLRTKVEKPTIYQLKSICSKRVIKLRLSLQKIKLKLFKYALELTTLWLLLGLVKLFHGDIRAKVFQEDKMMALMVLLYPWVKAYHLTKSLKLEDQTLLKSIFKINNKSTKKLCSPN